MEAITQRAYAFFEARGRLHGRDKDDWFRAEQELSFSDGDLIGVPNPAWSAGGCIQAVVDVLAREDDDMKRKLGDAQEALIRTDLGRLNCEVATGKFRDRERGIQGDCDALIETDRDILLVESKKEDMTMRAREGSIVDIVLDLADSLLKAQYQLSKQEWLLRIRGSIVLSGRRIELRGRRIERLVISLSDHGALHSRSVIMNILQSFAGSQFNVTGPLSEDQKHKLKRLNRFCIQLGELEREIQVNGGRNGPLFYDAWFLPLPFVRVLLSDSSNATAFLSNMRKMKSISLGTHDVFAEYEGLRVAVPPTPSADT